MTKAYFPVDIFQYLSGKVLGQEDVLRKISVALYKHIQGLRLGSVLLIGNSGTGKTTIMKSIQQFYKEHEGLDPFKIMTITNANMLMDQEGTINTIRLFKNLESEVLAATGFKATAEEMKEYIENATVCIDEIDKISSKISGKINPTGISIQQSLLTLLEGETILLETGLYEEDGKRKVKLPIDTSRMLFICGGAFEELHDQVHDLIARHGDERMFRETAQLDDQGGIRYKVRFSLKESLKLSDLFTYGMYPQFISRFSTIAVLDNLRKTDLKQIMLQAEDSPFQYAREYFESMGIEIRITDDALDLIATYALDDLRIGARALREVFGRIIADYEFNPYQSEGITKTGDGKPVLTIDRNTVANHLNR
ncbi:MAG: AAA domain-containing protein [Syntrophaceae bacterium]|nr:AAA domain-containing protein [Syntrophaceae bacterium]